MTNKLPKIGTVYRHTSGLTSRLANHSRITSISEDQLSWWMEFSFENGMTHTCQLERFLEDYEELPEDKAEIKPETQSHISELSPEVKEAIAELDKELDCWMPTEDKEEYRLTSKAERLLNTLNKRFEVNETIKETVNLKKDDEMQVSYKVLKPGEFEGRPPLDQLIREGEMKVSDVEKAKEELRKALPQEGMPILDITDEAKLLILERKAQALLDALDAEKRSYANALGCYCKNDIVCTLCMNKKISEIATEELNCKKHGKRLINDRDGCEDCVQKRFEMKYWEAYYKGFRGESKSIWKDVSELRSGYTVIVEYSDGSMGLYEAGEDNNRKLWLEDMIGNKREPSKSSIFITLTDFINEHNDMKERLTKLEKK